MKGKTRDFLIEIHQFGKIPENKDLHKRVIYVVRENNIDVGIKFLCPCGCGIPIWLPLGEDNNEGGSNTKRAIVWIMKDKIMSIVPSIKVNGGCNSHFHIELNVVIW